MVIKKALSENSQKVYDFLKANPDADYTAADIAEALGLETKSVNGIATGLQKKDITFREEGEIVVESEDGTTKHKSVKFIKLTEDAKSGLEVVEADAE